MYANKPRVLWRHATYCMLPANHAFGHRCSRSDHTDRSGRGGVFCEAALHVFRRVEKPFAPFDRTAATCADRPQRQPLTFVARKSWPKSRTKERTLASTRCAENNEQARRLACCDAAQRVDAAHDINAAAEKTAAFSGAFLSGTSRGAGLSSTNSAPSAMLPSLDDSGVRCLQFKPIDRRTS
jgi:hypothetical protein